MSEGPGRGELFALIRSRCARVAEGARFVAIDAERLEGLAAELARECPGRPGFDPAQRPFRSDETTVAYILTLDALNFGSGYFPLLRKRPGLSGYLTLATCLREHFEAHGPWTAAELCDFDASRCARLFGQASGPRAGELDELMELFARALRDLGGFLAAGYAGRFAGPIEAAQGWAEALVGSLAEMPLYRDVALYDGLEVPFYKRAQITCADLAGAFRDSAFGHFRDLDRLTMFADNLVPHVLRMAGVLRYAPALEGQIDAQQLVPVGSPEEVEIRAVALHAVERLVAACRRHGWEVRASDLDQRLWSRGQSPEIKAVPRHRTRCSYY